MLVLNRKEKERIVIGGNIEIIILHIRKGIVKVGIEAPADVEIVRKELIEVKPTDSSHS